MGCTNASSGLNAPKGARDLDPVSCSVRCLDEGYQVAALSSEVCSCGNQQGGLVASECLNTSTSGGAKDVRGQSERQRVLSSLPVGHGQRHSVALYRTKGPFLHSIRLSVCPHRVQAGKVFVVEVSGNLAGRPDQPTGIRGLGGQDFSYVTVEIQELTQKGQSSHHVSVLNNGSFAVSSDWILETPGKYELNVSVCNPLSTLSSTLLLSVLQPSPPSPVISVLHGPLGVPSCVPSLSADSAQVRVEAAYLGDRLTLQADHHSGLPAEFLWSFTHMEKGQNVAGAKTVFPLDSDCVNSTVNWTFETEGVHVVSVNASGVHGWTQQTIHVVVVRLTVSDLRLSVSGSHWTSGEGVSVEVELTTTMMHLLVLNLTLNAKNDIADSKDNLSNTGLSDNPTNINQVENHPSQVPQQENCSHLHCSISNHGNISYDHNLNQTPYNVCCPGGTLLRLRSDAHLHISNRSSCRLHLRLHCRLPTSAGQYHLTVSVHPTSDPSSVLLSTVLPRALTVYEPIRVLRPSRSWRSAVSTHAQFSLQVVSLASRVGSRVIWTFSLDDVIVMSRTTEEWKLNVSLAAAGCYKVTVEASNPVSWASFSTHILVQDPVGELVLNVPSVTRANEKLSISFSVTSGSNVTVSVLVNETLLYRDSSYTTGNEGTALLIFNHTGAVAVQLRAENRVSSENKSVKVRIERKRKPSSEISVKPTWQPHTSETPVHSLADGGEDVYLTPKHLNINQAF
uniref:uncharacterized protein LOC124049909 n=1 Tax=Scatophagus argus TaxID=75038 RepID=UPI001ED81261|nr:uncharacterized protein LOC124049909 [Scatophagus argus]